MHVLKVNVLTVNIARATTGARSAFYTRSVIERPEPYITG